MPAKMLSVAEAHARVIAAFSALPAESVSIAEAAGLSLTHMAMAFVMAHRGVTSAILGPRTMAQLDDLLAGAEVRLSDDVLDRIDQIAPPGADVGLNEAADMG